MASYRKRGKSWRVEIYTKGVRASATFDTKAACRDWVIEQEINDAGAKLGRYTLLNAFQRYSDEVSPTKKGARWETIRLNKFKREIGFAESKISQIEPSDIARWRDDQLKHLKPATVQREMNLLRSVFEIARKEWGWVQSNPMGDVAPPKSPKPRYRRISPKEKLAILRALDYIENKTPKTKKQITAYAWLIAIETAMRSGELLSLSSDQVFLEKRFVTLVDTKNSDRRDVPLNSKAVELFGCLPDNLFDISNGVLSSTFLKARKVAGIDDMTFHDSRHEALTNLAQKLHVLDLARVVGHRDPRSLMIYYNPTAEEIAAKLD